MNEEENTTPNNVQINIAGIIRLYFWKVDWTYLSSYLYLFAALTILTINSLQQRSFCLSFIYYYESNFVSVVNHFLVSDLHKKV